MSFVSIGNPLDAPCDTELVDMSPFGICLGSILGSFGILAIIPSLQKPIKLKSTFGVSPLCLILTNLQQTATVANTIVLKWPQVKLCSSGVLECQPSLIQLYTVLFTALILFPQHLLTVYYPSPPEAYSWNRKMWYLQLVGCGGFVALSFVWSAISDCDASNPLRLFGISCGLLSSVLMFLRFLPQIYITVKTGSSGSISYLTFALLGVGGFLATYFQVAQSHEALTTWLPQFVGNCFQTFVLGLCIVYDYLLPKRQAQDEESLRGGTLVKSVTAGLGRTSTGRESLVRIRAGRPSDPSGGEPLGGHVVDASGGYIVTPAAAIEEYIRSFASAVSRTSEASSRWRSEGRSAFVGRSERTEPAAPERGQS